MKERENIREKRYTVGYTITLLCAVVGTILLSGFSVFYLLDLSYSAGKFKPFELTVLYPLGWIMGTIALLWACVDDYKPGGLWTKFQEN